jgi:hypothetical protein
MNAQPDTSYDGGPAFPHQPYSTDSRNWSDGSSDISLRAYIATAVMSSMELRNDGTYNETERAHGFPEFHASRAALAAVRYADALIAELNKPKP